MVVFSVETRELAATGEPSSAEPGNPLHPPAPNSVPRESRWQRTVRWTAALVVSSALLYALDRALRYTPSFYQQRCSAAGDSEQTQRSKSFVNKSSQLILNDIHNSSAWSAEFDEAEINAWLAEDFEFQHADQSLPRGVRAPRVALEKGQMRVGFRYRLGPLSTTVHVGFRTWVPKRNVLAVELENAWAGALPIPTTYTRQVIERLAQRVNRDGKTLDVVWKRNGNRLVALLEFSRSEVVLQRIDIVGKTIRVRGINNRYRPEDYAPSAN